MRAKSISRLECELNSRSVQLRPGKVKGRLQLLTQHRVYVVLVADL